MNIVEVIPIARGIAKETLSYFTGMDLLPGSMVSIPLRTRVVPGIVIAVSPAGDMKTRLRQSDFSIRKIASKKPVQLLDPAFIEAARQSARYSATATGAVLHAAVPSAILEKPTALRDNPIARKESETANERLVLQAEEQYRFAMYKSLIREEFARGSSVFLCVPTVPEAERVAELFGKGIEPYTFLFHGSLTKPETAKRWRKALDVDHPLLIVATGSFLSLPRHDIGTYIVEREHSGSHVSISRPFLDFRILAENLARARHARFILADFPLRVETIYRFQNGEFEERSPLKVRIPARAQQELIDMRAPEGKHQKFEVIGERLAQLIEETHRTGRHLFLFTARRGLSPTTVCRDCGTTVSCDTCGMPVTLHKTTEENLFICHTCGSLRSANDRCRTCTGWRLEALGIGIQRVEEDLNRRFPDVPVFVIDRDTVSSHKQALSVMDRFFSTPGSVLLGTEMALLYLTEDPVEYSAIVSIDSLLSVPQWRIAEKLFSIILRLSEKTRERFLIQTRHPDHPILESALRGNVSEMYRHEIELRKQFSYPPLSVILKFSTSGTAARARKEMEQLETVLGPYGLEVYPPLLKSGPAAYTLHGLIRIPRKDWPNDEILSLIRTLPPSIAVRVDPDSLL